MCNYFIFYLIQMSNTIFTVWSIVLLCTLYFTQPTSGLNYESNCIPTNTISFCDTDKFLECIDYSCNCNSTMNWDRIQNKCGINVGQACVLAPNEGDPPCYGTAVCQENSGNPVCTCVAPDYPAENGEFCIHLVDTAGSNCRNLGVSCNAEKQLACRGSSCLCNPGWEDYRGNCYASFNTTCVSGSVIPHENCFDAFGLECSEETGRCECGLPEDEVWGEFNDFGFFLCQRKVGAVCNDSLDEFFDLHCVNTALCKKPSEDAPSPICVCPPGWIPSLDRLKCVPEVVLEYGENCTIRGNTHACNRDKNLRCLCGDTHCNCACGTGLSPSAAGVCHAGFESPCKIGDEAEDHLTCLDEAFLKCDDNSAQFYDYRKQKCVLKVTEECDPAGVGDPRYIQCPATSTCRQIQDRHLCWCMQTYFPTGDLTSCQSSSVGTKLTHGDACNDWDYKRYCPEYFNNLFCVNSTCQCPEGGYSFDGVYCYADYGTACNTSSTLPKDTCNYRRFLECSPTRDTCICRSSFVYEPEIGREACFFKLNSTCDMKPDLCVANAFCYSINPDATSGSCQCKEGYRPGDGDEYAICIPEYETPSTPKPSTSTQENSANALHNYISTILLVLIASSALYFR
ncbi:hypothetical protein Fcan01_20730 [Folsomia candida]|uniref:EGF-like domain-containing protein n=1 Tax=Folsomia candida TaxID=158441 RepID=A0A226DHJ6_FOLCA|nr:hypothetical protein Fcan01_20730 [Folsomia candida]